MRKLILLVAISSAALAAESDAPDIATLQADNAALVESANAANERAAVLAGKLIAAQRKIEALEKELAVLRRNPFSGDSTDNPFVPPPSKPTAWHQVMLISDTGNMRTPSFKVRGEWRIRYITKKTEPLSSGIVFQINVHGPEEYLAANDNYPVKERVTYGKKPGTYWLEVSALFCSWDLMVEELR